jgi:hypothetical protein
MSSSTTWRSSDATALLAATREVLISFRSSSGIYFSFSTSCLPCNILLLFNNLAPLTNFAIDKFSSSFVGTLEFGAFTCCAIQSWRSHPSSPIPSHCTSPTSSNCPHVLSSSMNTPSILEIGEIVLKTSSYSWKKSIAPLEQESLDTTLCLYYSVVASSVNITF